MNAKDIIIVGVDGSDGGRRALRWALGEAARSGSTVEAVTAWHWAGLDAMAPAAISPAEERAIADSMLATEIAEVLDEVGAAQPVVRQVAEGFPGRVLTEAAQTARLLVIGSHGHSRLFHSVLGSVSEECVRRAPCPVVVVPTPKDEKAKDKKVKAAA